MKLGHLGSLLSAAALAGVLVSPSQAAFVTIDDRDADSFTITVGGFDLGGLVNGNVLGTGGATQSFTFADGFFSMSASWSGAGVAYAYATGHYGLLGDPDAVTSAFALEINGGSLSSTVDLSGGGYTGNPYLSGPTSLQDGRTYVTDVGGLTVTFITEAVPEPGSLALVGLGLGALPLARRRRGA